MNLKFSFPNIQATFFFTVLAESQEGELLILCRGESAANPNELAQTGQRQQRLRLSRKIEPQIFFSPISVPQLTSVDQREKRAPLA